MENEFVAILNRLINQAKLGTSENKNRISSGSRNRLFQIAKNFSFSFFPLFFFFFFSLPSGTFKTLWRSAIFQRGSYVSAFSRPPFDTASTGQAKVSIVGRDRSQPSRWFPSACVARPFQGIMIAESQHPRRAVHQCTLHERLDYKGEEVETIRRDVAVQQFPPRCGDTKDFGLSSLL